MLEEPIDKLMQVIRYATEEAVKLPKLVRMQQSHLTTRLPQLRA